MPLSRRALLKLGGLSAIAVGVPPRNQTFAQSHTAAAPADYTIRIAPGLIELAPNRFIAATLYSDQFPGPFIRVREGQSIIVDVHNDTETPEQLHWHGQFLPVDLDGSAEEGTPFIPPHGHRRMSFTPAPAGIRLYHTHTFAGPDLSAGQYGGQVGAIYIEPKNNSGNYDQELFLVLKEFTPFLTRVGDDEMDFLEPADRNEGLAAIGEEAQRAARARGLSNGFEVEYQDFTINGRILGEGEPIRVKANQRVLLHVVNASATDARSLALPGHMFRVVALDGNPVPSPADVPVLWLGPAERVSAFVEMSHPGVWIMGDVGEARYNGMGVVVEYAGATGAYEWIDPPPATWDYRRFGGPVEQGAAPEETLEMVFAEEIGAIKGFNRWSINGTTFAMHERQPAFTLQRGRRYRLRMRNASDDMHPIHLHRHTFELTRIAGRPTAGVLKDVVMLGAYQEMEVDFTATSPGLSLFHCHMQVHMDYGFMTLLDCR